MTACPKCHNSGTNDLQSFCSCEFGSIRRISANRQTAHAYAARPHTDAYDDRTAAINDPFPDDTVRNCHSQILTSLSIMDRCKRRDLVRIVCSHPGCESRVQVERELDELIEDKEVGLEPDWDNDSTDGDDIVFHIVKPEWMPTKGQEEACEVRREASRHASIINRWLCVCAFLLASASILYTILTIH